MSNFRVKLPVTKTIEDNIFEGMAYIGFILYCYLILYSTIKIIKKKMTFRLFWDNIQTKCYVISSKILISMVFVIGDFTLRLLKNIKKMILHKYVLSLLRMGLRWYTVHLWHPDKRTTLKINTNHNIVLSNHIINMLVWIYY